MAGGGIETIVGLSVGCIEHGGCMERRGFRENP
jgi:hypothetical protein